jgi:Phosphotransferase enzyme family
VFLHDDDSHEPVGVLKVASSVAANSSLERSFLKLNELRADVGVTKCGFDLQEIEAEAVVDGLKVQLEKPLNGTEGRNLLAEPRQQHQVCGAAALNLRDIAHASAGRLRLGQAEIDRWVYRPIERLSRLQRVLLTDSEFKQGLDFIKFGLADFWEGKELQTGLGHGDYCPGNLLFDVGPRNDSELYMRVAAILDWEGSERCMPAGLDAVLFILVMRSARNSQELGKVVRDLLLMPSWSPMETEFLKTAIPDEPTFLELANSYVAIRAYVGLTWLLHIFTNLEKSESYANNRIWKIVNVERVIEAHRFLAEQGGA